MSLLEGFPNLPIFSLLQSFAPEFVTAEPPDSQDSAGCCARNKEETADCTQWGALRVPPAVRSFSCLHFLCNREGSEDPHSGGGGGTPGALEQSVSNRITKWCLYDFLLLDLVEEKDFLMMFIVQIHVGLFATPWTAARPGSPVHHYLLEFAQIHVHWIGDVIQPSHPLSPPFSSCLLHLIWAKRLRSDLSPLALNLARNRGPFQWVVGSLHLVVKVLERLNVIYFFMTQFESFCISRKKAILMLNC